MKPLTLLATCAAALTLTAAEPRAVDQWPQFRGPNATGNAAKGAKPPVQFGPDRALLWKADLPEGHGSPAIWGDHIFVTGYTKADKKLEAIAISAKDGKILWRQAITPKAVEQTHPQSNPAAPSPATDGERVYYYYGSYGIVAYDFEGKQVWEAQLPLARAVFGNPNSPVIAGDNVIVTRDYLPQPQLYAYSRKDGKLAWMVDLPKPTTQGPNTAHATPVIWKDQIVLHRSGELAGYSSKDGTRLWWTPLGSQGASPPVAQGDVIYVNAYSLSEAGQRVALPTYEEALAKYDKNADGKIQLSEIPGDAPYITRQDTPSTIAFSSIGLRGFANFADFNKNGVLEPEEWKQLKDGPPTDLNGLYAVAPKGTGQLPAESILWKDGRNLPEVPAPIVYGDRVCNINNGGILSCFEAKTGKVIHRGRIGTPGAYFSSPIYAAGQIYVASTDGVVSVIKADNYETLSKADLGEGMFATPAALGSRLYVRTTGHLWAFGDK